MLLASHWALLPPILVLLVLAVCALPAERQPQVSSHGDQTPTTSSADQFAGGPAEPGSDHKKA
jgi:hypothetical protein